MRSHISLNSASSLCISCYCCSPDSHDFPNLLVFCHILDIYAIHASVTHRVVCSAYKAGALWTIFLIFATCNIIIFNLVRSISDSLPACAMRIVKVFNVIDGDNVVHTISVTAPFALSGTHIFRRGHIIRVILVECLAIVISITMSNSLRDIFSQLSPPASRWPRMALFVFAWFQPPLNSITHLQVFRTLACDFAPLGVTRRGLPGIGAIYQASARFSPAISGAF